MPVLEETLLQQESLGPVHEGDGVRHLLKDEIAAAQQEQTQNTRALPPFVLSEFVYLAKMKISIEMSDFSKPPVSVTYFVNHKGERVEISGALKDQIVEVIEDGKTNHGKKCIFGDGAANKEYAAKVVALLDGAVEAKKKEAADQAEVAKLATQAAHPSEVGKTDPDSQQKIREDPLEKQYAQLIADVAALEKLVGLKEPLKIGLSREKFERSEQEDAIIVERDSTLASRPGLLETFSKRLAEFQRQHGGIKLELIDPKDPLNILTGQKKITLTDRLEIPIDIDALRASNVRISGETLQVARDYVEGLSMTTRHLLDNGIFRPSDPTMQRNIRQGFELTLQGIFFREAEFNALRPKR